MDNQSAPNESCVSLPENFLYRIGPWYWRVPLVNMHLGIYHPRSKNHGVNSVTRSGDFSKFLATNFLTKVAQVLGDLLGYLKQKN